MTDEKNRLSFEIGFYIKSRFTSEKPDKLFQPSFIKYEGDDDYDLVLTKVCLQNIDELILYYKSLFESIERHNEKYPRQHIWLRPGIFCDDEVLFSFPWHDRLIEIEQIHEALIEKEEGTLLSLGDQGWYFEIYQMGDKLLFYETSHEEEMDFLISSFEDKLFSKNKKYHFDFDEDGFVEYTWAWEYKSNLLHQIENNISTAREVIDKLVDHFKVDYWSKY